MVKYKVIRSRRKTLALQITPEGPVVRAPKHASDKQIEDFVSAHRAWLEKHLARINEAKAQVGSEKLTPEELRALADRAAACIPARAAFYAAQMGVTYGRITIRSQKTKWGSCSSKKNLNFNCLLMLTPPEVIDCIVVHELAHLKEMNHSERFYREVLRVYPAYYEWHGWLKAHGAALMARLPE